MVSRWSTLAGTGLLAILCTVHASQDPPDGSWNGTCRTRWKEGIGTVCGNSCSSGCQTCERSGPGSTTGSFCKCETGDCSEPTCCHGFNRTSQGGTHIGFYAEGDCDTEGCPGPDGSECNEQPILVPAGEPAVWKAVCSPGV